MHKRKIIFNNRNSLKYIKSYHIITRKRFKKKRHKRFIESSEINTSVNYIPMEKTESNNLIESVEPSEVNTNEAVNYIPVEKVKNNNPVTLPIKSQIRNNSCNFCTMASNEYVFKVLALHRSLKNSTHNFKLWICCMDEISYSLLSKLKLYNVYIFRVRNLEDTELLSVKSSRKANEYCWTLKAPLIKYILDTYKIPDIIYCDSDLYFFSDPKAIYDEWSNYDVFLCPQRDLQWVENIYGKYQAGLIGFKNTDNAMKYLHFWRNKCIEWCSATPNEPMETFGDQKYLDKFPLLYQYEGLKISDNLGVNAAPWNCIYNNNYNIYKKDGYVYIEKNKLVAFHFATIDIFNSSEFDLWSFNYIPIRRTIKDNIYLPYLTTIRKCIDKVKSVDSTNLNLLFSQKALSEAQTYYRYPPLEFRITANDDTKYFCTIISKQYLIKGLTFYRSLKLHGNNFHLWICCVDDTSYSILNNMKLESVTLIPLGNLEDDELRKCKKTRNATEFCWTLKAPLVQYVLENYDVDFVIYCDADIFFFSDPSPILENWIGYYFYICTQRDNHDAEKVMGRFQAGFIGFKKLKESYKILKWWRQRCIEWCFDYPQPELQRWGDQKYLDQVPLQFVGIKIENNLGINAAPWNVIYNNYYTIHNVNNKVYVNNDLLIFYHFGSMLFYNEYEYDLWKLKRLNFNNTVIDNIYIPYLNEVKYTINEAMPYIKNHLDDLLTDKESNSPVNYFNIQEYKNNIR